MIDPRRKKELEKCLTKLGLIDHRNVNWEYLNLALTHISFSADCNYEQLEFVGDSVIRLITAELLIETYPEAKVGDFAGVRSVLVSDRILAQLADYFGLEPYLLTANSAKGDKLGKQSRLADCFEAVLGALYLSTHNMSLISPWLMPILRQKADILYQDPIRHNYKDALQDWTQSHYKCLPNYRVTDRLRTHSHQERFLAQVWIQEVQWGEGTGESKKMAEQNAARIALEKTQQIS